MIVFTNEEKLAECDRELTQRHRVYRWQVKNGKMSRTTAERQIALMNAIRLDYVAKVHEVTLFSYQVTTK